MLSVQRGRARARQWLLIGFVEELLTHGITVKTLRHAGDREWTVATFSSLVFTASHGIDKIMGGSSSNTLLDGAGLFTFALVTIGYILLIFISGRVSKPEPTEEAQTA